MDRAINELEHTRDILVNNYNVGDADGEAQQNLRLDTIASIDMALRKLRS